MLKEKRKKVTARYRITRQGTNWLWAFGSYQVKATVGPVYSMVGPVYSRVAGSSV